MELKVTYREYTPPYIDPETNEKERGEFLGSFSEVIEGNTPAEILATAITRAEQYSTKRGSDVRMWEMEVTVTPRGIVSR